jgi:hypothetical protein
MLAESVFVEIDEDRLDALAESLDAALTLMDGIDGLAESVDMSVAEPYEAAWQGREVQR